MNHKIYHLIKPLSDKFTFNQLQGEIMDMFNMPSLEPKKVLLILDNRTIANSFFKYIREYREKESFIWMLKRTRNIAQLPDVISYLLPNGCELETLTLDNQE